MAEEWFAYYNVRPKKPRIFKHSIKGHNLWWVTVPVDVNGAKRRYVVARTDAFDKAVEYLLRWYERYEAAFNEWLASQP